MGTKAYPYSWKEAQDVLTSRGRDLAQAGWEVWFGPGYATMSVGYQQGSPIFAYKIRRSSVTPGCYRVEGLDTDIGSIVIF